MNMEVVESSIIQNDNNRMLLDLNYTIHGENPLWEYHLKHILYAEEYALIMNERLGNPLDAEKLSFCALSHDILKERSLDVTKEVYYGNTQIPQDTKCYVRMNLDVLEEYALDDYFNTSLQFHPLAAGIFLYKEFGVLDNRRLYPIFFHSSPIVAVYKRLDEDTRLAVDIMMLADKLSSNYLRINYKHTPVRCDLDLMVFGPTGREFNWTLGLLAARTIGQGKSVEEYGLESLDMYLTRARNVYPFIPQHYSIKKLGGATTWQPRKSQVLRMP